MCELPFFFDSQHLFRTQRRKCNRNYIKSNHKLILWSELSIKSGRTLVVFLAHCKSKDQNKRETSKLKIDCVPSRILEHNFFCCALYSLFGTATEMVILGCTQFKWLMKYFERLDHKPNHNFKWRKEAKEQHQQQKLCFGLQKANTKRKKCNDC